MNKMQMAHDYALKQMESLSENSTMQSLVSVAWQYADAMQAEEDKRKPTGAPEAIREAHKRIKDKIDFGEPVKTPKEYKRCKQVEVSEWQPDWSQAPEWANWWAICSRGQACWYGGEPVISEAGWGLKYNSYPFHTAPSFNYQGNWQDSLRKRPQ